jgi:hypothetical protein
VSGRLWHFLESFLRFCVPCSIYVHSSMSFHNAVIWHYLLWPFLSSFYDFQVTLELLHEFIPHPHPYFWPFIKSWESLWQYQCYFQLFLSLMIEPISENHILRCDSYAILSFRHSPPFLFAHQTTVPPIGNAFPFRPSSICSISPICWQPSLNPKSNLVARFRCSTSTTSSRRTFGQ